MHQTILGIEHRIVEGFTAQEQAQFLAFLDRAISNMGGNPCNHHHKEDTNA